MINHFTSRNKVCHSHFLPLAFLCSDPLCPGTDMLCSHCVTLGHPHLNHIHTLSQFSIYLLETFSLAKRKYEQDKYSLNISQVIKNKKQEIESIQLMLLEQLTKRLSQQKRRIFSNLEQLERTFIEQELAFNKNHTQRLDILQYITPYANNPDLLELKLRTNSRWGLTRLKENINELQTLSKLATKQQIQLFQQKVRREISLAVDLQFFKHIRQSLRDRSQRGLLNSVQHLNLRKDWPIQKRGEGSTRPNSSVQFKPRSVQGSRRSQCSSNVVL